MLYKLLIVLHLLGSSVWIGGHIVLVLVVLPKAMRKRDPIRVRDFERGFAKVGLSALALQVFTGLWLTTYWGIDWRAVLVTPTPAAHLALSKVVLLAVVVVVGVHAERRVLPRLSAETLGVFAAHAWTVTLLSLLMLIAGAGIRTGGLF